MVFYKLLLVPHCMSNKLSNIIHKKVLHVKVECPLSAIDLCASIVALEDVCLLFDDLAFPFGYTRSLAQDVFV